MNAWSKDQEQSLAQLLLREGILDRERLHALQCLASSHLTRHNHDLRVCLDAWNAQELTLEVMTEIGDGTLKTTLGMTLAGPPTPPVGPPTPPVDKGSIDNQETLPVGVVEPTPSSGESPQFTQGERFVPIRPYARGGIGQVWVARDCELQREVALKVIQPQYADREDQRARFLIEAEITGNLEHPGIVPVYSLGRNADGRPYYAMRFIRGESFSAAIREFHRRAGELSETDGGRSRSMWGIEFRQLLGRFLDVCDAIDYAHSRGVLHRDLKPANIMLGRYGETLVVDWGLAKVIGKADITTTRPGDDFEPSLATSASDTKTSSGDTQEGQTIGTPAYMSPEQARGRHRRAGTCQRRLQPGCHALRAPHRPGRLQGRQGLRRDRAGAQGGFSPSAGGPAPIPAPLEAICLKAMAFRPDDRYPTVRGLADDLEHWLADEPVAAYPERRPERAARWLRQHRTWTYAAGAALIGISLAATIGVVVVEQGRRREAEARELAQTNFKLANTAVRDYLTSVSQNTLLKQQDSVDIRALRKELLETALKYYKEFVKQRGDDTQLRQELAEAHFRVGEIAREIGTTDELIIAFDAARAIWEQVAASASDDPAPRGHAADCYLAIGERLTADKDFQAAIRPLESARAILEPIAAKHPDVAAYEESLAECYKEMGLAQAGQGLPERGLESLKKAEIIQKRLIDRSPKDDEYRKKLADIINVEGYGYYQQGDYTNELRSFQEVQCICQSLLDQITSGPPPVQLLNSLALAHYNIATVELRNGNLQAALAAFERSLVFRSALVTAHPSVTDFQENLGVNLAEIAQVQYRAGQTPEAFASIRKSIDTLQKLADSQPDQPRFRAELGRSWNVLGYLHDEIRDNAQATTDFTRAIAEQERAVAAFPGADEYQNQLCVELENLGEQHVDLGSVADGLPHYRRAIGIRESIATAHPRDERAAFDLADKSPC